MSTMRLARFHEAQQDVWPVALAELRAGLKQTHWMWFIFPQLAALGHSATAKHYGIADLAEARAYLADPVLGPRLHDAARAVLSHPHSSAQDMFGQIDALKLCSSATLFEAAGGGPEFAAVLDTFYAARRCPLTRTALAAPGET
ncbi:DUF1810 domain-containing protein [Phaeovulum sp.]|uniref:DUF1810 domain-containing protein n=1 Tax=Phaeovulum sp. TaxID=2934796 RepID=UPI003563F004